MPNLSRSNQPLRLIGVLLTLWSWPPGADSVRRRPVSSLRRNSSLFQRHAGRGAQPPAAPPLKVLASTYNAANRKFDHAADANDMLSALLKGHEEADLVVLGFQEYLDTANDNSAVSEHVRKNLVWSSQFSQKAQGLHNASRRLAPQSVVDARKAILSKFEHFQSRVMQKLKMVKDSVGSNSTFANAVASADPATQFVGASVPFAESTQKALQNGLDAYAHSQASAPQKQFRALAEGLKTLQEGIGEFNIQDYDEHFQEIHQWSHRMHDEHQDFLKKNPNLQFTEDGRRQYAQFLKGFQHSPTEAYSSVASLHLANIQQAAEQLQGRVEQTAAKASEDLMSGTITKWDKVLQDVVQLQKDMEGIAQRDEVVNNVASSAAAQVQKLSDEIGNELMRWKEDVQNRVGSVGDLDALSLEHSKLEIPMLSEVFDSDSSLQSRRSVCHGWSHYNTDLRIYANPWSPWKLDKTKVTHYSIDYNGETSLWKPWSGQCGKGTNVMKVRLEADAGHHVNLCVLNSHQSFKYSFKHRLHNLKSAMDSLKGGSGTDEKGRTVWTNPDLNCHAVIFTADFNSRLMCKPSLPQYANANAPVCEQAPSAETTSFQHVVSLFCAANDQNKCALGSSDHKATDELTQMLEEKDISCFDKKSKSPSGFELHEIRNNPLFQEQHRLREAAPPNFAFTYKLANNIGYTGNGDKGLPLSDWNRCFEDENLCLLNMEQDFKHNPAWTDRILVRDSDAVRVTTEWYNRRAFTSPVCNDRDKPAKACSDHAPVVAMLGLEFKQKV